MQLEIRETHYDSYKSVENLFGKQLLHKYITHEELTWQIGTHELRAIVCNFRIFVGHFIQSIWLKFGMKSYFRVLITKWILISSSYFCLPKRRESALVPPILARQYGGLKVIFWIQLESYRRHFSKSRDIRETIFPPLKNMANVCF